MSDTENKDSNRKNSPPLKKCKTKPRTKQPKKVKFIATEIRCHEQAKGGLKFDVILAEPAGTPPKPIQPLTNSKSSENIKENIEEKLKAADERRLSLEANKMAVLAAKLSKIEEASKKKDEQNNVFVTQTKEALDQKMELYSENREAYISDLKNKLRDHLVGVDKARKIFEKQTEEIKAEIDEKLKQAKVQRDENIKKIQDRLKQHEEQAKRVREALDEKVKKCELEIKNKLQQAKERREIMEKEQIEKLRLQNTIRKTHSTEIRLNLENERLSIEDITEKLKIAEQKRQKELEKKLEKSRENERRAEMVRQNKEKISSQEEEQETASSG
uniref:Stathmin n=1 Tax=Clastoptera arizonana TaxID=38151 RepID=A0A1B6DRJ8_9HEMI